MKVKLKNGMIGNLVGDVSIIFDNGDTYEEESREYNEKDVLHRIRLYNEHSYPNGIVIVKKDAKINYQNKINAKISDIKKWMNYPDPASDYEIEELLNIEKEAIENNAEYDKCELDKFIKKNIFIKELKNIYNSYLKALENE